MYVRVSVHAAGDGARLYHGHRHPLLRLRDGTHPLAVGSVNPGLFPARADQTGRAGGCQKNLGPAGKSFRRTTRPASAESEARPGPRPPTLRRRRVETRKAGPEALSTSSLPNRSLGKPAGRAASPKSDRPVMARCRCGDLAVGGGSSALVTCGHGAARSWIDGHEMAVNGLDAYLLPRA